MKNSTVNRKLYIEVLRIIAAFLVIVNHTNVSLYLQLSPSPTWLVTLIYTFICVIAVPIFLMITGALLLDREDIPKQHLKRIIRIVIVTICFSLLYYIYFNFENLENLSLFDFFRTIFSSHITNAFWYLYTYVGILVLMPLLQKMAKVFSKRDLELLLIITLGLLGIIPIINTFTNIIPSNLFLEVFFSPYIGMLFAGYYIQKHLTLTKKHFIISLIVFVSVITLQVLLTGLLYSSNATSFRYFSGRQYLTTTCTSVSVFIIIKYLFDNMKLANGFTKIIQYIGSLTFGIYLLSDLIIEITKPLYNEMATYIHIFISLLIWELLIFIIGIIITAIIKTIPIIKKWL